jgi:cytidyltransferase-like protein
MKRVYCDGIFDLFHFGHLNHFKKIITLFSEPIILVVGVISDNIATNYKRKPIVDESSRLKIIKSCVYVNDTFITDELIMTEEFLTKFNIDFVVHGFTPEDRIKQSVFFEIPIKLGKFIELDYHQGISTTNLINRTVTTLDQSVRHEDIYNLLQERINIENSSIVGEFGYEDDLLSKINPRNYYCIDINNNKRNHLNLFIYSNEKMFKSHFFDYIIVNNFELCNDSEQLLNEFYRICEKGIYISNINNNNIDPDFFIKKGFNIVNNNTLCYQGYDAFKEMII